MPSLSTSNSSNKEVRKEIAPEDNGNEAAL
jgi:hypothetical protein